MPSLAYYLLLCLYLRAHAACRPLVASDNQGVARMQDVMNSVAEGFGSKSLDHDNNEIFPSVDEAEKIKENYGTAGKKVKTPCTRKIIATEIGKRGERSTLEYSASDSHEENVRPKNKDGAEDIDVMDYAQPHRKPPIHNRGT